MLIAFNTDPQLFGGGGFNFIRSLSESLARNGHYSSYSLKKIPDAIIVVSQDRKSNFSLKDMIEIKKKFNTKIILRINNLDTHAKKGSISHYNKYRDICDAAVYMSEWSRCYAKEKFGLFFAKEFVVHNSPREIFYSMPNAVWNKKEIFRIVTHHWSTNRKKGFDFYSKIGKIISKSTELSKMFHLCYIGRSPKRIPGFIMKPFMRGRKIVEKICCQHAYLTASEMEVGPNHVAEGLACGLPVLYGPNGGATQEYVNGCGFQIDLNNPISSLISMRENYDHYSDMALNRKKNYDPNKISNDYISIIKQV